jgi:hypothetical protein
MTQAERFMQFVQQRNERAIQDLELSIRIDEGSLVVTQRWIDNSATARFDPSTAMHRKTSPLSRQA